MFGTHFGTSVNERAADVSVCSADAIAGENVYRHNTYHHPLDLIAMVTNVSLQY